MGHVSFSLGLRSEPPVAGACSPRKRFSAARRRKDWLRRASPREKALTPHSLEKCAKIASVMLAGGAVSGAIYRGLSDRKSGKIEQIRMIRRHRFGPQSLPSLRLWVIAVASSESAPAGPVCQHPC